MPKSVTIYTTRYCPHCQRAKDLLKRKGIAYQEIDLTDDEKKREEAQERTGWMTVPMIFIGDQFVGGADELTALEKSGNLDKQLSQ